MKKIHILTLSILMAGSVSAQLVNGNFEDNVVQGTGPLAPTAKTQGWYKGVYTAETVNPGQGVQSLKLTSIHNNAVNVFFGGGQAAFTNDDVPGFASTRISATITDPANFIISLFFKYTPVNNDRAGFAVEIYDTMQAGISDDVLLYKGLSLTDPGVSFTTWSLAVIDVTATGNSGTPNSLYTILMASVGGFYGGAGIPPVSPGSVLFVDNVETNIASLGIEEPSVATVKIYPNPTADVLNFELENGEATAIHIYSIDGKLMLSDAVNGTAGSINVAFLNAGMYFYEIAIANGATAKNTFIKE